ncbi:MAG: nucleotidyltransferase domain-containing protein [Nakamurella multipartita]
MFSSRPRAHVYGVRPALDQHMADPGGGAQPAGGHRPGDLQPAQVPAVGGEGQPDRTAAAEFAPASDVLVLTEIGASLRAVRSAFLSQDAVRRFLGYMGRQHERMLLDGQGRPELIERDGWDTKFGAHALRLALQGWELAATRRLKKPARYRLPSGTRCSRSSRAIGAATRVSAAIIDLARRTSRRWTPAGARCQRTPTWRRRSTAGRCRPMSATGSAKRLDLPLTGGATNPDGDIT